MAVPWFVRAELRADRTMDLGNVDVGFPCVVKPLGLSGSRGVIRANSPAGLAAAVDRVARLLARLDVRALRIGFENDILIEGFIDGRELAVEGIVTDGLLRVLAIFDKPDPLDGPFFEETIYVTPPALSPDVEAAVRREAQRAVSALGLWHGPVHAECRVSPAGVVMLEAAARPIGGLCARVLRFDGGVPLEELLLHHALDHDVGWCERERPAAGVMMIPIPKRGLFRGVEGEGSAVAVEGVEEVRITAKPDQLLEPLPEGASYLGFIFARAARSDGVVAALREAHRRLRFTIETAIDVAAPPPEPAA
jgi:biotin carboxylase